MSSPSVASLTRWHADAGVPGHADSIIESVCRPWHEFYSPANHRKDDDRLSQKLGNKDGKIINLDLVRKWELASCALVLLSIWSIPGHFCAISEGP